MTNAKCGKDYKIQISISDIDELVVKFNGSTIAPVGPVHIEGDIWEVEVAGASIPIAGELVYSDDKNTLATVTVDCP